MSQTVTLTMQAPAAVKTWQQYDLGNHAAFNARVPMISGTRAPQKTTNALQAATTAAAVAKKKFEESSAALKQNMDNSNIDIDLNIHANKIDLSFFRRRLRKTKRQEERKQVVDTMMTSLSAMGFQAPQSLHIINIIPKGFDEKTAYDAQYIAEAKMYHRKKLAAASPKEADAFINSFVVNMKALQKTDLLNQPYSISNFLATT